MLKWGKKWLVVVCLIVTACGWKHGNDQQPINIVIGAPASNLPKWCVNVHQNAEFATTTQIVNGMAAVGANCARDALNWDQVEQSSGTYNWAANSWAGAPSGFQSWWNGICGAGYYAIMGATYNNPLYDGNVGAFAIVSPGSNTTAYLNYAGSASTGGKSIVNNFISTCPGLTVELYNEPNLTQWTNGVQWGGGAYLTMAQTTAAAVKTAQSSAKVSSGGVSPGGAVTPNTFGAQMVAGATFSSGDYWALHPYNYNEATPANTLTPTQLMLDVASFAAAVASQPKPIIITEYGFPLQALNASCTSSTALNLQGTFTGWAMLQAVVLQLPIFAWYELVNGDTEANCAASDQVTFGLLTSPNDSPALALKPAGTAFKSVTDCFASAVTYDVQFYPALNVYEITVHKASSRCKAIWYAVGGHTVGTLAAAPFTWSENMGSFSSASAADVLGNAVTLGVSGSNVSLSLSESVGPVIVTLN